MRILTIGCIDVLITLPVGILFVITEAVEIHESHAELGTSIWYPGWTFTHTNWGPEPISWADLTGQLTWQLVTVFLYWWSSVILALAIFALLGFTSETRRSYGKIISAIGRFFKGQQRPNALPELGEITFNHRPVQTGSTYQYGLLFFTSLAQCLHPNSLDLNRYSQHPLARSNMVRRTRHSK